MAILLSSARRGIRRLLLASALLAAYATPAMAEESLTLYTTREPGLIQPFLDTFT